MDEVNLPYSPATAVAAEGARVGFVTCLTCGVALLLSMQVDVLTLHEQWHEGTPDGR